MERPAAERPVEGLAERGPWPATGCGLAGALRKRPAAARARKRLGRNPGLVDDERLQVRMVAAMGTHAVHPRRLGIETAHRCLAADRAGTGHGVLGRWCHVGAEPVQPERGGIVPRTQGGPDQRPARADEDPAPCPPTRSAVEPSRPAVPQRTSRAPPCSARTAWRALRPGRWNACELRWWAGRQVFGSPSRMTIC